MESTVLVFLGVAMGISPTYAGPFETPKLEPAAKGAAFASEFFLSQDYRVAFQHGARHACNQSEHAAQRYADMLQANCVAADMSANVDWGEIRRHCFTDSKRSAFERQAEETCAALSANLDSRKTS